MNEADDSSGLRLRIHHLLLAITVYAIFLGSLDLPSTLRISFPHMRFWLSVILWPAITTAGLVILWWRFRSILNQWHPADCLIIVLWCILIFNPVAFDFWSGLFTFCGMTEETLVAWGFAVPGLLGFGFVLFIAFALPKTSVTWWLVLFLLALGSAWDILSYGLEHLIEHPDYFLLLNSVCWWKERTFPLVLSLCLVVAICIPKKTNDQCLCWPRLLIVAGTALSCLIEFAYLNVML